MEKRTHPTYAHGKICYVEIPSTDSERAAAFYEQVFGWSIRRHAGGGGAPAFDDGAGEVSGSWVSGRSPRNGSTLMVHIMVDDMDTAIAAIVAHGGTIVRPVGMDAPEITAHFSDPDGNVMGLYQSRRGKR